MSQKTEMECYKWIAVIKFGDENTHIEQTTSFGIFDTQKEGELWVYETYKGENVIAEILPFNDPFDLTQIKRANLRVIPPNDEEFFGELDDEHQPTEQDEWLDYDPEC